MFFLCGGLCDIGGECFDFDVSEGNWLVKCDMYRVLCG